MLEATKQQPQASYLALYDRAQAEELLRNTSADGLLAALREGRFGARLAVDAQSELGEHLTAWVQRALGSLPLRDALLIDNQRGPRVFALLCAELTVARITLSPAQAALLPKAPGQLNSLPPALAGEPVFAELAGQLAQNGLALVAQRAPDDYPFPGNLAALTPSLPKPFCSEPAFVQPTGWRRRIAAGMAAAGVALLALPMLLGHMPRQPAGLPLALLTMALLVGIRAGWTGFAGSLCIWLVANLPGFRHGTSLATLWPALPLLIAGLALLRLDRQVRAMWRWVRRQVALWLGGTALG